MADLSIDATYFGNLSPVDLLSIALYLLSLAGVTLYVNRKVGSADTEHYFLGGRDLPWWAIGFSLFASNLGTDHLVGLAGSGAAQGIAVGAWEWVACYVLMILGWVFVPHYLKYGIYTVPEYLEKRFDESFRTFFTWLSIAATLFTKISVTIFAGSVVMQEVLGWNKWLSSVLLLVLTGAYTSIGGLAAVVYTEVLQSLVLMVGSFALLWYGMHAVGGWSGLQEKLPAGHFELMKPIDHKDFPWPGVLLGMPISSIWYWCTDQVMVQRVLAAKSVSDGQRACVFAGWLKVTPMFMMVLPGLIAAALYPQQIEEDSNRAFALLVTRLLPAGWQGPMIAVMLSSFMAALASCFNSCSTLFTMDIYARRVPDHTEAQLVWVGQVFTVVLAALSVAWLPVIEGADDELFLYIQGMQLIWCAPVAAVFLAACLSDSLSCRTAWTVLVSGIATGLVFWLFRSGLPVAYRSPVLKSVNVLHFSVLLFAFSCVVMMAMHVLEGRDLGTDEEKQALMAGARESVESLGKLEAREHRKATEESQWAGLPTTSAAVLLVAFVTGLGVALSV